MTRFIWDDFAAGGGWEEGLRLAGYTGRVVGVEFEANAVATARAAGHERIHGDVRAHSIKGIRAILANLAMEGQQLVVWGYIASPPCQTFSAAGNGAGRKHLAALIQAVRLVGDGYSPEEAVAMVHDEALDERSVLVLHPLHVIRETRPSWILLEQVKEVRPIWDAYADVLRGWGYAVRVEIAKAERYGVPQTRRRAILSAKLGADVAPWPVATHSEFHTRDKTRLDPGVLPWVPMADVIEWGMTERPSMTVTGGGTATGGAEPFGNASRQGMRREAEAGRWRQRSNYSGTGKPGQTAAERGRTMRELDEPSVAVTGKSFQWEFGDVVQAHGAVRHQDEPAATVTSSADNGNFRFREVSDAPASERVSVRVTVQEAGLLQSFPADYPWQGTKNAQFQIVGNAVPPVMARAFVAAQLDS